MFLFCEQPNGIYAYATEYSTFVDTISVDSARSTVYSGTILELLFKLVGTSAEGGFRALQSQS